jgi:hypothetical protein
MSATIALPPFGYTLSNRNGTFQIDPPRGMHGGGGVALRQRILAHERAQGRKNIAARRAFNIARGGGQRARAVLRDALRRAGVA